MRTGTEEKQHLRALREANRIRIYRAGVKKRIAEGTLPPFTALNDPDCATMRVVDLVVAVPRVGRTRARRIMRAVGSSESRTIESLTPRQRVELAAALGNEGNGQ